MFNKPLNLTVYMPVCYICNSRFLSQYKMAGRQVCAICIKLPPDDFLAALIKADDRARELRYKKD